MDFDDTLDVTGRCSAAAVVCDSTPLAVQGMVWIKKRVHFHLNLTDRQGPSAFVRRSETDGEEIQKSIELGEGVILLLHVLGWNGIFLIRNATQTQQ